MRGVREINEPAKGDARDEAHPQLNEDGVLTITAKAGGLAKIKTRDKSCATRPTSSRRPANLHLKTKLPPAPYDRRRTEATRSGRAELQGQHLSESAWTCLTSARALRDDVT